MSPELGDLSGVDAVVIAASTEAHHDLALRVLSQDMALLVEKPVCDTLAASEQLVAVAEQRDVPLMCGLLERHNPVVMTALSVVKEPLHLACARRAPYASRIRTGAAWDLLAHDVDVALRVFGGRSPDTVRANAGYFDPMSAAGAEDVVDAVLGFPGGRLRRCRRAASTSGG